ncbi:MAG: hypothetical protein P4L10_03610 [Acidobacteriaceae bacterium]|jgi:hypothetical protein|nr:hypothetical protein [Acidobacteriaceae bacterium]
MTHYVLATIRGGKPVPARLSDDPAWSNDSKPVLLIGAGFDERVQPSQILWIDGSADARKFAAKGGYKALSESDSECGVWQTVILKDRAAAGGRATKGVVSAKKLKAIRKNARMGGRPSTKNTSET